MYCKVIDVFGRVVAVIKTVVLERRSSGNNGCVDLDH